MGNSSQIWATVALTSAAVPSKSFAVRAMQWAICFICWVPRPLVVTAAVPMRTPLVTEGFWGSPGMAFLKPSVTSGVRIGTAAATTRGLDEEEMKRVAKCIGMTARDFEGTAAEVKATVADICEKFPLYR